jgi:hypothetical protein
MALRAFSLLSSFLLSPNDMPKIAILTPAPDYWENWSLPKAHYERLLGPDLAFRPWTDPATFPALILSCPLLTWGYQRDVPGWFALLDRLEAEGLPLANPAKVLRWNSDKAYLAELSAAGVATVPTLIRESMSDAALASAREILESPRLVVKPPISGGADGTLSDRPIRPAPSRSGGPADAGAALSARDCRGWRIFALLLWRHLQPRDQQASCRGRLPRAGTIWRYRARHRCARRCPGALAETALAATDRLLGCGPLTYARIDMVRDGEGAFRLMELELIEPSLFLHFAADEGALFAEAVKAKAQATR